MEHSSPDPYLGEEQVRDYPQERKKVSIKKRSQHIANQKLNLFAAGGKGNARSA